MNIYISKSKLVPRETLEELEAVIDNTLCGRGKPFSINWYDPATDGTYVDVCNFVNYDVDLVIALHTEGPKQQYSIQGTLGKGQDAEISEADNCDIPTILVSNENLEQALRIEKAVLSPPNLKDWTHYRIMKAAKEDYNSLEAILVSQIKGLFPTEALLKEAPPTIDYTRGDTSILLTHW